MNNMSQASSTGQTSSTGHIPFNFQRELDSLGAMSAEALKDRVTTLERDRLIMDSQLTGYEEGVDSKSAVWYKQAKYVYRAKGLLIEAANREIKKRNESSQVGKFVALLAEMRVFHKVAERQNGETGVFVCFGEGKDVVLTFVNGRYANALFPMPIPRETL